MINNKLNKIILIIITTMVILVSVTYFTRTVIDIGCAKTMFKSTLARYFLTINCNFWEKTLQIQANMN